MWHRRNVLVATIFKKFNVNLDRACLSTFIESQKDPHLSSQDAQSMHDYCKNQEQLGLASFRVKLGDLGVLESLFYIQTACLAVLRRFGQVLSVDATFGTNKFGMKLVLFCISDNSSKTFVVAWGIIQNEAVSAVKWMFNQLLEIAGIYRSFV